MIDPIFRVKREFLKRHKERDYKKWDTEEWESWEDFVWELGLSVSQPYEEWCNE